MIYIERNNCIVQALLSNYCAACLETLRQLEQGFSFPTDSVKLESCVIGNDSFFHEWKNPCSAEGFVERMSSDGKMAVFGPATQYLRKSEGPS